MRNDDLNLIWNEIEVNNNERKVLQRLVYIHLLWRAYIGSSGLPSRRFLSIEIPEGEVGAFDEFSIPQGFTLSIGEPGVKHKGYVACILQASTSDQNDVFSILAQDILEELSRQNNEMMYISTLKMRILKWSDFFKNTPNRKLSDKEIIGLIGELTYLKQMSDSGFDSMFDFWNGPIKSAQDFQGSHVSVEIKTSVSNCLELVHISSEEQLDDGDWNALYLVVYRIENNNYMGFTLPELIDIIVATLPEQQKKYFFAKLLCMGYVKEDEMYYKKRYSVSERKVYEVKNGFPRIVSSELPKGIKGIKYCLCLDNCNDFELKWEQMVEGIKRCEYGENG